MLRGKWPGCPYTDISNEIREPTFFRDFSSVINFQLICSSRFKLQTPFPFDVWGCIHKKKQIDTKVCRVERKYIIWRISLQTCLGALSASECGLQRSFKMFSNLH